MTWEFFYGKFQHLAGKGVCGSMSDPLPADPVPPEDINVLTGQDWRRIILRLTRYASYKLARLWFWNGTLPQGCGGPEDVASDAIAAVLTGHRSWTRLDGIPIVESLLNCLKGVVDSQVNHLVESADNQKRSEMQEMSSNSEPDILSKIDFQDRIRRLREYVRGDPELCAVIDLMKQGLKPRDIARNLGVPAAQVYQWIRTLKRRARSAGLWPERRGDEDA